MKAKQWILLLALVMSAAALFLPYMRLHSYLFEVNYAASAFEINQYLFSSTDGELNLSRFWNQFQSMPESSDPQYMLALAMTVILWLQPLLMFVLSLRYGWHAFKPAPRAYLLDFAMAIFFLVCNSISLVVVNQKMNEFIPNNNLWPSWGFALSLIPALAVFLTVRERRRRVAGSVNH